MRVAEHLAGFPPTRGFSAHFPNPPWAENVLAPTAKLAYANVWEPKSINGGTPKYLVSLIIPKSNTATVAKIKSAIEAAYQDGQAKLKGGGKSVPSSHLR